MTNVLHLSDTTLSGSPIRIMKLTNKYSKNYKARHCVWNPVIFKRVFELDVVGKESNEHELRALLDWADIIHYHNRWKRQEIFKFLSILPPNKPSVIQIHSPKDWENFSEEIESGLPIAVIAQFHVRQWNNLSYIVPNCVDIFESTYMPMENKPIRNTPIVSYAPSSTNGHGWNSKGYEVISRDLKRMKLANRIIYQLIIEKPHNIAMELKRGADIGIDEIVTGSYHMSSLEYMAMGIPCFSYLDSLTAKVVKDLTGAEELPFINAGRDKFLPVLQSIITDKSYIELGKSTRLFMEKYWNPQALLSHYEEMYKDLVK
jgi:hypothetical protein